MGGSKTSSWVAGTVLVALLIVAGAWFLLISPQLAAASETRDAAVSQEDANTAEEARIKVMAQQFLNIDDYRAQLAALQLQIPERLEIAEFERQLSAFAETHDVTIATLTVSASEPALGKEAQAAAPAAAGGAEAKGSALTSGFYHVPLDVQLIGGYSDVLATLEDLQTSDQRLFLVRGLMMNGVEESDASGGIPALKDGDLDVTVSGSLFVLQTGATTPVEDADESAGLPESRDNPFAP